MKSFSPFSRYSVPMPLWMQGAVEMLITAFISFGAVFVLLLAVVYSAQGSFDVRAFTIAPLSADGLLGISTESRHTTTRLLDAENLVSPTATAPATSSTPTAS